MKPWSLALVVLLAPAPACGPTEVLPDDDRRVDAGPADPSDVGQPDAATCLVETQEADRAVVPADIVWIIDNSGSMGDEEARVQANMNAFAAAIAASGIDYHVVVIADRDDVNVPPPLGGSARLVTIDRSVDSHDALELAVQTYPQWQTFLRADSVKHFVVVSDDESDWSQSRFETALAALGAPGFPDGFRFHAIVAERPPWDTSSACFGLSADVGQTYIDLAADHDGVFYSLCQTNWAPVFAALSEAVSQGAALPCSYDIPDPGAGQRFDFGQVNVVYTPPGGAPVTIPNVGDAAGCGAAGGWYYDDPAAPTRIEVCGATCDNLAGDGRVDVEYGCATIID